MSVRTISLSLTLLSLVEFAGLWGQEPAPKPSAPVEAEPGPAGGDHKPGILTQSLKNVLNTFSSAAGSADAGSATEAVERGSNEEIQKKVNELNRSATTNIEKGRVGEAVKNVNDLITQKPYDADYHFALGLCFRQEGKYAEAMKKYQDVMDLGGPKALIALLRAEASAAENKPDKVFEFLREAAIGGRNIITDVRNLPLLSNYQTDTEFIKLSLQLEKFSVSAARAHDPFTNPFPRLDKAADEQPQAPQAPTTLTPEEQEKLLSEAKRTYERVQFYIKLEDEAKAMKAYASLREMVAKKELLTVPKIVNEFRLLLGRIEALEVEIEGIRLKYYYNVAQGKLKQMKDMFSEGEYRRVETLHSEIVKLTQEMDQANVRYKPVADQIRAAAGRWIARAQIRQEFEARKPNIQGVVIAGNVKMALLNDRVVKQGEAMDDFRIVNVENNKVTFRYKGEEIPLVFRRY